MAINFKVDEVFTVAEMIEKNGAQFYRRAAENLNDPDVTRLLTELAGKEDEHLAVFSAMRKEIAKSGDKLVAEPDDEQLGDYLRAWAGMNIFRMSDNPLDRITGAESVIDILKIAIDAEKDSVVFYLGMKQTLPTEPEREKIDRIIWEEMNHYASLMRSLAEREGTIN